MRRRPTFLQKFSWWESSILSQWETCIPLSTKGSRIHLGVKIKVYFKIHFEWIKDLEVKMENREAVEENMDSFFDLRIGGNFLRKLFISETLRGQ